MKTEVERKEDLVGFMEGLGGIQTDEDLLDYCRRYILHGTPAIFQGAEAEYYNFRKRIAAKFSIHYNDVLVTGSAMLGFSPIKNTIFSLDSDVDVALISSTLFDNLMLSIHKYQMSLRENRRVVREGELLRYHTFLEYCAMGWMRPDHLPHSFSIYEIKQDWFDFFKSISYNSSEVGNYKVTGGAFKSHYHLEQYTFRTLRQIKYSKKA